MNPKTILICLHLIASTSWIAYGQSDIYFLPFSDSSSGENLFGYKNQNHESIIPAKYQSDFYVDTLWLEGFLRTNSPNIIAVKHQDSVFFQAFMRTIEPVRSKEDLYRFEQSGKMGFMNKKGEIVIPAKYDFVTPFNNGFAEFYNGCHKRYIHEAWYYAGDYQIKGYLNTEGMEYTEKTVLLNEKGYQIHYTWKAGGQSCEAKRESYYFDENGIFRSYLRTSTKPNCEQLNLFKYELDDNSDTIYLENRLYGKLDGEFIKGHYDYYVNSISKDKVYSWYTITSLYSDGSLIDFKNNDIVFLNNKSRKINKKKLINQINKMNLTWTYTYIPQEVYNHSGVPIKFIVHPKTYDRSSKNYKKSESKILKYWISREFNRIIYHSEKISISIVDTIVTKTKSDSILMEKDLSQIARKRFIKSLSSELETKNTTAELPSCSVKITSQNGELEPTIIWYSMTSGDIYLKRDIGDYFTFEKSTKLNKKINRMVRKLRNTN